MHPPCGPFLGVSPLTFTDFKWMPWFHQGTHGNVEWGWPDLDLTGRSLLEPKQPWVMSPNHVCPQLTNKGWCQKINLAQQQEHPISKKNLHQKFTPHIVGVNFFERPPKCSRKTPGKTFPPCLGAHCGDSQGSHQKEPTNGGFFQARLVKSSDFLFKGNGCLCKCIYIYYNISI